MATTSELLKRMQNSATIGGIGPDRNQPAPAPAPVVAKPGAPGSFNQEIGEVSLRSGLQDARSDRQGNRLNRQKIRQGIRDDRQGGRQDFLADPRGTLGEIPGNIEQGRINRSQDAERLRAELGLGPELDPFLHELLESGGINQQSSEILQGLVGDGTGTQRSLLDQADLNRNINEFGDFQRTGTGGLDRTATSNINDLVRMRNQGAGQLGSDVKGLFGQLQQGDTALETQITDNALKSLRGELTAPDSQFAAAARQARLPAFQDALRATKEAAGKRRGIGGGRFDKQLQQMGTNFTNQSLADITALQQAAASKAPDIASTRRGQDINLTGIASGLGQNAAANQLNAANQIGGQTLAQQNLALGRDQFDRGTQQAALDRLIQGSQFEDQFGLRNRGQEADISRMVAGDLIGNQLGVGNLLRDDKQFEQNIPNRVEKGIDNFSNLISGAERAGVLQDLLPQASRVLRGKGTNIFGNIGDSGGIFGTAATIGSNILDKFRR